MTSVWLHFLSVGLSCTHLYMAPKFLYAFLFLTVIKCLVDFSVGSAHHLTASVFYLIQSNMENYFTVLCLSKYEVTVYLTSELPVGFPNFMHSVQLVIKVVTVCISFCSFCVFLFSAVYSVWLDPLSPISICIS